MECEPLNQRKEIVVRNDIHKISYVMSTFPTVIKTILQFLPSRDLCSCALVCKFWNNIAKLVKTKRNGAFFIRMPSIEKERPFCELLLSSWSEPNLVIVFGALGIDIDVEFDILGSLTFYQQLPTMPSIDEMELIYVKFLKEIGSSMNNVRRCLPKKCQLIRVPLSTFCKLSTNEDNVIFNPLTSLVIPSMQGVEMGVFSIPTTVNVRAEVTIEKLYVSKQYSTWSSDFKCILLFANFIDSNGTFSMDVLTDTQLKKFISDKTIIIGGRLTYLPISTGITFAGENTQIECIRLTGNMCCTKSQLAGLKKLGFHKKMGIAFLLSSFISYRSTFTLFQELFPNILLFGIVSDGHGLIYPKDASNLSLEPCDECGSLLNINDCKVPASDILLLVMYKEIICKVIDL